MFRRLARKALRRLIESVRSLLQEPTDDHVPINRGPIYHDFAFGELNSILTTLQSAKELRPNYTWGVLQGLHLARVLGIERVSLIEFGVAGGNGLVALERAAIAAGDILGVQADVYGFDTGQGLPKPVDYRDLPNLWVENAFSMDVEKLREHLATAQLVIGEVKKTVPEFIRSRPAPVAFMSFDLDYYSSTVHAFELLEADHSLLLPRIPCYFDDIMAFTFSDYTGERLAISEFNTGHTSRKISPIYGLEFFLPTDHLHAQWPHQFYFAHFFDHPLYCQYDGLVKRYAGTHTDLAAEFCNFL